jgi:hypothetical protein
MWCWGIIEIGCTNYVRKEDILVTVKNQPDATKYAVLLPQHVSGTNMPIIRSTISEYLPHLGGYTWKAAWVVPHWTSWSEHCSEDGFRPLMMGILVPKTC